MEDVLLGTSDWLYQHKMILNICSQEELMTDDEHSQLTDDAEMSSRVYKTQTTTIIIIHSKIILIVQLTGLQW